MANGEDGGTVESLPLTRKRIDGRIALSRAYLRIGRISRLDKVCRIYLRALIDAVRCDGCAIIRVDGDNADVLAQRGFVKAFAGADVSGMPSIRDIVPGRTHASAVDNMSRSLASYVPDGCSIASSIGAPIVTGVGIKGIIYAYSLKENAFDGEDIEFTRFLSSHMSVFFEQSSQRAEVQNMRPQDRLEGCFNEQEFRIDFEAEINSARKYQEEVSLLRVRLNGLKKHDGLHGSTNGSQRLVGRIVDVLSSNVRAYQKICRYGEQDFMIVMSGTGKKEVSLVARRLRSELERELLAGDEVNQPKSKATISIGVATFPSDAAQADRLIEAAESSLLMAAKARSKSSRVSCDFR